MLLLVRILDRQELTVYFQHNGKTWNEVEIKADVIEHWWEELSFYEVRSVVLLGWGWVQSPERRIRRKANTALISSLLEEKTVTDDHHSQMVEHGKPGIAVTKELTLHSSQVNCIGGARGSWHAGSRSWRVSQLAFKLRIRTLSMNMYVLST